jgi:hypothetical protein
MVIRFKFKDTIPLQGNFVIFYMLAKYVPGDIKYIFTKFYRHISTNNEANRKFVILISNLFMGCDGHQYAATPLFPAGKHPRY